STWRPAAWGGRAAAASTNTHRRRAPSRRRMDQGVPATVAGGTQPGRSLPAEHETEPTAAGPADRMGNRVARAAGKKQTRRKGATSAGTSRTGKRLALAGAKKRARAKPGGRKRAAKKRPAKRTVARKRAATAKRAPAKRTSARTNSVAVGRAGAPSVAPPKARAGDPAAWPDAVRESGAVLRTSTAPAAFSVQREGATMRDQLLFE